VAAEPIRGTHTASSADFFIIRSRFSDWSLFLMLQQRQLRHPERQCHQW
jgi:hypothetical protein